VLNEAGELADSASGWKRYLRYLEFLCEDEPSQKTLVCAAMSRGWCIGSDEFCREMRQAAKERGAEVERYAGLEPDVAQAERHAAWEEQLQRLAKAGRIDLAVPHRRKSHPDKVLLAAALKRSTSVSNRWLAERLQMGEPASASQFVRRLLLREDGTGRTRQVSTLDKPGQAEYARVRQNTSGNYRTGQAEDVMFLKDGATGSGR
jgi:hypothetical protein